MKDIKKLLEHLQREYILNMNIDSNTDNSITLSTCTLRLYNANYITLEELDQLSEYLVINTISTLLYSSNQAYFIRNEAGKVELTRGSFKDRVNWLEKHIKLNTT